VSGLLSEAAQVARGLLRCLGRQKTFGVAETRRRGRSRRDQWGWGRRSRNASSSPARQRRYRPPAAQGKSPKVQGKADGTRSKGKDVVNAETAASALSSTYDNTVRVADAMQRLAVQGTVQPVGGKGTALHWTAGLAVVMSGGLGMPDVHGRPAARDIKAASNCDNAHVLVVTASDVHFSRVPMAAVLEQVLLAVRQDAVDRPSPPDASGKCRPRVLTEKPKVKRVYPSTSAVHESAEKRKRRRSATLTAASKGVASVTDCLQP
jgi:hypothetical protein